jgi:hypothetical protein
MNTDTPEEKLRSSINEALLRANIIRAIRDFQNALMAWKRPDHWAEIPDDFIPEVFYSGGDDLLLDLIGRIGIDPGTAKAAVLGDPELPEEERKFIEDFVEANTTWPAHCLELIAEGYDEFTLRLLNRCDTPPELVAAFDRVAELYQRFYEKPGSITCLDESFNRHTDLEQLIEEQSRTIVQGYSHVLNLKDNQYHAVVERKPSWVDDEYQFLQHTRIYVTLLSGIHPVARLTLTAEVDHQDRPFSDGDYFNFKDSMDGDSAIFADMLIEWVQSGELEEDSVFEMLRYFEGEPSKNAFLHIHDLEIWKPDIVPGLAVATMLGTAIRAVTEPGAGDLMTAPLDTSLDDLVQTNFKASEDPLPVEWPALCDRVTRVFIADPLIDLDDVLDSPEITDDEKADYQVQRTLARDAFAGSVQYLPVDFQAQVHFIRPEQTDFFGEMMLLAKHNFR